MMMTGRASYDTAAGIREHLADGLGGLRRLMQARREAGYDRKERLEDFVIAEGRYWLDTCGNTMACDVTVRDQEDASLTGSLPSVLSLGALRETIPNVSISGRMAEVPAVGATCPECGDDWDLSDCHNAVAWRADDDSWTHRHKLCAELARERDRAAWYRDVCRDAGLGDMVLVPVPSGYWKTDPSWCRIRTPKGDLVIGWRKRVVNVEWTDIVEREGTLAKRGDYSADYEAIERIRAKFDGEKLFASEDVTKGPSCVHAWTRDKLIEYLRKISEVAKLGAFKPVAA